MVSLERLPFTSHQLSEERMTTTYRTLAFVLTFALAAAGGVAGARLAEARDAQDKKAPAGAGDKGEPREKSDHADRININTADVKQLMTLAGVHKKTAEKIVEYRQSHGLFKKPEEVVKVDGIGHALYEKNRARIVIE
jgi:competence ComEA-like helix-hairpin-helix protein